MEALIELKNVTKEYAAGETIVRALRDVTITLHHGEFVAIVGASGSGKSTLMNILGCLDRPTHGTYSLAGIDAGGRSNDGRAIIRNRLIGFIFQGFNLLPRTTALENCELPLQYRGVGRGERRTRATKALESVGLGDRLHHTPNQLSGGQQQRVAIARALVTSPPLLLADEPTGNLDTRTSLEVLSLLQELNRTRQLTIVLVTHEADIAACASRVITVKDGRIQSDVRQPEPMDAAAKLGELPPPDLEPKTERDDEGDVAQEREPLGAPLRTLLFFMMALGALLGAGVGGLYCWLVLKKFAAPVVFASGLLGEALLGASSARRAYGRPLTTDQRWRLAFYYSLGTFALIAVLYAMIAPYKIPFWIRDELTHRIARGLFVAFGLAIASVGGVTLLRYLLLTLVVPSRMRRGRT